MILTKGSSEIKILEINPLFWASIYASLNAGINFADLYVRISNGEDVKKPEYAETKFIRLKMGCLKNSHYTFEII